MMVLISVAFEDIVVLLWKYHFNRQMNIEFFFFYQDIFKYLPAVLQRAIDKEPSRFCSVIQVTS